ncbi:NUDIX hydrolase [Kitasatospora sp. NPDC006697]|uniref:NUDIX hydrolase n=1 Tax=Kitasatospora sp. NPDC006697 TaxID=3364020 RepID=UPI00369BF66E
MRAFEAVRIRVGALVFCGEELALLRRSRPDGDFYSTIGGNVEPGEDLRAALWRELDEELGLAADQVVCLEPELIWVQDAMVPRPGPTPPPRKLHLHYRLHVTPAVRAMLASEEYDLLPDGTRDLGRIEWIPYRRAATLPLFPPIGPALSALVGPDAPAGRCELEPVTERTYTWR